MENQFDSWAMEILSLIENELLDDAEDRIDMALAKNQSDPEALNLKGYLIEHRGAAGKAKEYFRRALESNPKSGRLRAAILGNLRRPKESLQVIESYLAEHPDDAFAWIVKASPLSQLGQFVPVIDCFNKALQLDPTTVYAYKYKAIYIREIGKQFNILICWISNGKFKGKGLEPNTFWGLPTQLCSGCYKKCLAATMTRSTTCIEIDRNNSTSIQGTLLAFSFANLNKIVFEPHGRNAVPIAIHHIVNCQGVTKDPNGNGYLAAVERLGLEFIRVDYTAEGDVHSLVFDIKDDCDTLLAYMRQISEKLKD
jgi:tetratricopeptide (TPR) repeat protein